MHRTTTQADLRDTLVQVIRPLIGDADVSLVDYPAHGNVGDHAIWLGSVALLSREFGRRPKFVSHYRFPAAKAGAGLGPDDIILINGGGNFGSIYPHHQRYREEVVTANPDRRVIQLPQSIHYEADADLEHAKRAFGTHRDFHLCVRDLESADFARTHFDCEVHLAPDMAMAIERDDLAVLPAVQDKSIQLRIDRESRLGPRQGGPKGQADIFDWRQDDRMQIAAKKVSLGLIRALPASVSAHWPEWTLTAVSRRRVTTGLARLCRGRVVVTDRLHGHILASLAGRPTVVLDNSYRKTHRFISQWGSLTECRFAETLDDAYGLAEDLLGPERQAS